jgi:hypothetical protein
MPSKKTNETFIQESKQKYGEKFNYSLCTYTGSTKKITLICKNNHTFTTTPSVHLSSRSKGGCTQCHFDNLPAILTKYNQETFIQKVSEIHHNQYDYSKTIYKDLQTPLIIICKLHGEFTQKPICHLHHGYGCNECGRIRTTNASVLTNEEIEKKLNKFRLIHNNRYQYGKIFRENMILWLEIICPKHGSHITRFFNHEKGHGCPKCVSVSSKVQIQWLEYRKIRDGFIQHIGNMGEYVVPSTKLCVDGYQKESNTIYEFQGDFWHGNPDIYDLNDINKKMDVSFGELYRKTCHKISLLKDKGYHVIEMWENKWRRGVVAVKKLQRLWRSKHKVTA